MTVDTTSPATVEEARRQEWHAREAAAQALVPLIGSLYRDRTVVVECHGHSLVRHAPLSVLQQHVDAATSSNRPVTVERSLAVVQALVSMGSELGACRVDAARLADRVLGADVSLDDGAGVERVVRGEILRAGIEAGKLMRERPQDVIVYGFGRIGRLVARILLSKAGRGDKFRLRAVVVRPPKGLPSGADLEKRAALLRTDSVHGTWEGLIEVDREENALLCNGNLVRFLYASAPGDTDFTAFGIEDAVVVDSTGAWRDESGLSVHLKSPGVGRVLLTAPGSGSVPNVVFGVNHASLGTDAKVVSAASCTTNAIVPVLSVVESHFGVSFGHIETVHSYTNDQLLLDGFHKKARRGRAAPLNLVLTETGAAAAVAKAVPSLKGKLTGSAIRVPTPNVSLAILNLHLKRETTVEELNGVLQRASEAGPLMRQIGFSTNPDAASSDFVGRHRTGIVDAPATIVNGENPHSVVVYVHYDNEAGYSAQVVRLVQHIAAVLPPTCPKLGDKDDE